MNVRRHMALVVGGGSCLVLLLMALVFLLRADSAYRKQSEAIDREYRRLAELNVRSPFPSVENVERLAKNLVRLEQHTGTLIDLLARDPFPPNTTDAAGFSARAQGVIERFRKRAKEAGITLPESLEAGFAEYASGGAIPAAEHVSRLSRQLYSAEKVADVLVRSGVVSIDTLTREVFEAPTKVAPPSRRRSRGAAPVAEGQNHLRTVASAAGPAGLYHIERVGATFTATETGAWKVLDQLAAAPHFMVVTDFSHTTQTEILAYEPDPLDGADDVNIRRFIESGILTGDQALSLEERTITGHEILRISIAVDVYNFEPLEERRDQ